jgi:hypothetical protein
MSLRRPLARLALIIGFFTAFSAPASSGGNGVRGGGLGVFCSDWRSARLFESLESRRLSDSRSPPSGDLKAEILAKLDEVSSTYLPITREIRRRLDLFGPSTTWPKISAREVDEPFPLGRNPLEILHADLRRNFPAFEFRDFDDLRVYDEQVFDLRLPPGCRFIQLAIYDGSTPKRTPEADLLVSKEEAFLLELHEAVYSTALDWFANISPRPTHRVISALLDGDRRSLEAALSDMATFSTELGKYTAAGGVSGAFRTEHSSQECPDFLEVEYYAPNLLFVVAFQINSIVCRVASEPCWIRTTASLSPRASVERKLARCGYSAYLPR